MATLAQTVFITQHDLFPALQRELDIPLSSRMELFVMVCELLDPAAYPSHLQWRGRGRPRAWRLAIALSLIAKAVWGMATTRALLDRLHSDPALRRLCGWERRCEIPSESTFSRAFDQFARTQLPQRIHEAMVRAHRGEKLVGHLSRDASAIPARERPAPKPKPAPKSRARRGRPRKGEVREPRPPRRLDVQPGRTLEENLADLPLACDSGGKKNSKGHTEYWIGYKLHLDVADGEIPVSALLTSASLHDSQAAIPLAQMSASRVRNLYELMDSAYDAPAIRGFSEGLGHVPLIDPSARRGGGPPLDPAQRVRFRERTTVERVFGDLKDNHGGRQVRVRGAAKVMAHLMWGLIVVTAKGLVRMQT